MKVIFNIEPVAKGRPKVSFRNGKIWAFTPNTTQKAEDAIKAVLADRAITPFPAGMALKLTATFYRHKSKWLKGKQKKETVPVRKPDLDNMLKLLLDSINGIIMPDDSQVTTIVTKKRWSTNSHGYIECKIEVDKDARIN